MAPLGFGVQGLESVSRPLESVEVVEGMIWESPEMSFYWEFKV